MIGQTKATGFQAGKRRTFGISPEQLWRLLCSSRGQELLGRRASQIDPYTEGVSTFVDGSHYRQTVATGAGVSTLLQVRVIAAGKERATLALHVEKLHDSVQREEFLKLFDSALQAFEGEIDAGNRPTLPST